MAAITLLGSTFNTTSGTHTVTATPALNDLIVIVVANSGSSATTTCTDNNSAGTYTTVSTAQKAASADIMMIQIRTALIGSAVSTIFTNAPGTTTGGGIAVYSVSGMKLTGATAAFQNAAQANQAAAGTPAPALTNVPDTNNPIISAVFNASSPGGVTARSSPAYTRDVDLGYATPTTGLDTMHINSGETTGTITWGSTSVTAFSSSAIELNAPKVISVSDASVVTESLNSGLSFDGAHSYVLLKSGRIIAGLTNWSMSAWIKTTNVGPIYVERAGTGNDILKMEMDSGGTVGALILTYRDDGGTLNQIKSGKDVHDGLTHHVVITKSGTSISTYVDAVAQTGGTLTATNNFTDASTESRAGADAGDSGQWFNGTMDDVAVYNTAISSSDVTNLYNLTYPTSVGGCIGYWPFDNGTGTTATDRSTGGNNGTLSGTVLPTWTTGILKNTGTVKITDFVSVFDSSAATEFVDVIRAQTRDIFLSDSPIATDGDPTIIVDLVVLNDSSTVTDSLVQILLIDLPNVFDSSAVTDVIVQLLMTYFVNVFDASAATDVILQMLQIYLPNVFDTSAVTESTTVVVPIGMSVFESSTVTDVVVQMLLIDFVNLFDSSAVTEFVSVVIPMIPESVFDSSAVTENLQIILIYDDGTLFDASGVTDIPTVEIIYLLPSIFESSAVTDAIVQILQIYLPNVFDSSTVTDVIVQMLLIELINVTDSSAVTESITISIITSGGFNVSVGEDSVVTESIIVVIPMIPESVFDSSAVTENVQVIIVYDDGTLFDASTTTDVPTVVLVQEPVVFDSSTVTDVVAQMLQIYLPNVFESSAATDVVSQILLIELVNIFDASSVLENVVVMIPMIPESVFDSSAVTDVPTLKIIDFVSVFDSSTTTESITITTSTAGTTVVSVFDASHIAEGWKIAIVGNVGFFDSDIYKISVFESSVVYDRIISPQNLPVGVYGYNYDSNAIEVWGADNQWHAFYLT